MDKQPGQFGILALLVLMTAVGVAFAVVRLPVDPMLKLSVVFAIAICFYGWAMRNWKYADPRAAGVQPPARRRWGIVLSTAGYAVLLAVMVESQMRASVRMPAAFGWLMWGLIAAWIGTVVWRAVRSW